MASDAASDLRRLLASRLSESDHELLTEDNLQILIEKQYTTAERLSSARREGLREPPALSSAFVDALLNTFQPGDWYWLEFPHRQPVEVFLPASVGKQHRRGAMPVQELSK